MAQRPPTAERPLTLSGGRRVRRVRNARVWLTQEGPHKALSNVGQNARGYCWQPPRPGLTAATRHLA